MNDAPKCAPPEGTADRTWHWVQNGTEREVWQWYRGGWWGFHRLDSRPEAAARQGWRYLAPCTPPGGTAPMPKPQAGQIWRPTEGNARPKIICSLSETGGVYAAGYPREHGVLPSYLSAHGWAKWVEKYGAVADAQ